MLRAGSQSIESHRRKRQTLLDAMDRHGSISTVEGAALLGGKRCRGPTDAEGTCAIRHGRRPRPYPRPPVLPFVISAAAGIGAGLRFGIADSGVFGRGISRITFLRQR